MKSILLIIIQITFYISIYSQNKESKLYFGEKGWLPGSTSIIVELDSDTIKYEMYIHYYTDSYYEKKKGLIIINNELVTKTDSIEILVKNNKLIFHDYSNGLKKKLKRSDDKLLFNRIRNLSYIDKKARLDSTKKINRWELYENRQEARLMNHDDFCKKVDSTYTKLMKER